MKYKTTIYIPEHVSVVAIVERSGKIHKVDPAELKGVEVKQDKHLIDIEVDGELYSESWGENSIDTFHSMEVENDRVSR